MCATPSMKARRQEDVSEILCSFFGFGEDFLCCYVSLLCDLYTIQVIYQLTNLIVYVYLFYIIKFLLCDLYTIQVV